MPYDPNMYDQPNDGSWMVWFLIAVVVGISAVGLAARNGWLPQ